MQLFTRTKAVNVCDKHRSGFGEDGDHKKNFMSTTQLENCTGSMDWAQSKFSCLAEDFWLEHQKSLDSFTFQRSACPQSNEVKRTSLHSTSRANKQRSGGAVCPDGHRIVFAEGQRDPISSPGHGSAPEAAKGPSHEAAARTVSSVPDRGALSFIKNRSLSIRQSVGKVEFYDEN